MPILSSLLLLSFDFFLLSSGGFKVLGSDGDRTSPLGTVLLLKIEHILSESEFSCGVLILYAILLTAYSATPTLPFLEIDKVLK